MAEIIIPTTIDRTGATEVGPKLQAIIDGAPDGTTFHWPDFGIYKAERGLQQIDRVGLIHEANGSNIKQTADRPYGSISIVDGVITEGTKLRSAKSTFTTAINNAYATGPGIPTATQVKYVDPHTVTLNKTATNGTGLPVLLSMQANRGRCAWNIVRGRSLCWRNMPLVGSNEAAGIAGPYDATLEGQDGMWFAGTRDLELDHVDAGLVYGAALEFAGSAGLLCSGYVHDGSYVGTGGPGITLTGAEDLRFARILLAGARRSGIDIEPFSASGYPVRRIQFADSIFGSHQLFLVSSGGLAAEVGLFEFLRNCIKGAPMSMWLVGGNASARRGPYIIKDNRGDTPFGTPAGCLIAIEWALGATVTGNYHPLKTGGTWPDGTMYGVRARYTAGFPVDVHGNQFPGGRELRLVA